MLDKLEGSNALIDCGQQLYLSDYTHKKRSFSSFFIC